MRSSRGRQQNNSGRLLCIRMRVVTTATRRYFMHRVLPMCVVIETHVRTADTVLHIMMIVFAGGKSIKNGGIRKQSLKL